MSYQAMEIHRQAFGSVYAADLEVNVFDNNDTHMGALFVQSGIVTMKVLTNCDGETETPAPNVSQMAALEYAFDLLADDSERGRVDAFDCLFGEFHRVEFVKGVEVEQ